MTPAWTMTSAHHCEPPRVGHARRCCGARALRRACAAHTALRQASAWVQPSALTSTLLRRCCRRHARANVAAPRARAGTLRLRRARSAWRSGSLRAGCSATRWTGTTGRPSRCVFARALCQDTRVVLAGRQRACSVLMLPRQQPEQQQQEQPAAAAAAGPWHQSRSPSSRAAAHATDLNHRPHQRAMRARRAGGCAHGPPGSGAAAGAVGRQGLGGGAGRCARARMGTQAATLGPSSRACVCV
jgi:hypothetical protein